MTDSSPSEELRQVYEAYASRAFDRASRHFSEEAQIINHATGDHLVGRDGYLHQTGAWAAAFPDLQVEILSCEVSERVAAVQYALRGTHTGPFITSTGFLPPTQAHVDLRLCDLIELRDGQITRLSTYFDCAGMLRQMGLLPHSPLHVEDRRAPLELYATEVDTAAQQRHKAIVHRFMEEVMNQQDLAAAASLCAPDVVWHGGELGEAHDLSSFQNRLRSIFYSFPDLTVETHDVIAENDRVAVRVTLRGTQLGHFRGIPPTGRKVTSSGMNTFRIVANRIVEEWWQHDLLGLLKQLDAVSTTPASAR